MSVFVALGNMMTLGIAKNNLAEELKRKARALKKLSKLQAELSYLQSEIDMYEEWIANRHDLST